MDKEFEVPTQSKDGTFSCECIGGPLDGQMTTCYGSGNWIPLLEGFASGGRYILNRHIPVHYRWTYDD